MNKEKNILELVQWIDNNESKLIKFYDILGGVGKTFIMVVAALFFVAWVANLTISDFATTIPIQLTSFTILIAFIAFVLNIGEKRKLEIRFERAQKERAKDGSFSDREKTLLKALIKIKSNNEEIKLMTIYEMDKEVNGDIFTEKKLLESICK